MPTLTSSSGPPLLDPAQLARMASYGVAQQVRARDVVFRPGDAAYDLIVIESGRIEIISPAAHDEPEAVLAEYGPGGFLGELNLLTGQAVYLTARVVEPGTIHRLAQDQFRRLMSEHPDISDILLRAFLARRDALRDSAAAHLIEIVGSGMSAAALALRTYAARQRLPHVWLDADSVAGQALIRSAPLAATQLPAVITPDRVLPNATPGALGALVGLAYRPASARRADLVIVGAGPAGLGAAVHAASDGLEVIVLDAVGAGGQAAASSRVENYVGFPSGISGADLTQKATLQAMKFGAQLFAPCQVAGLDCTQDLLRLTLADGVHVDARAVLIASGVAYRTLPLERWEEFQGAGIFYAATELEARGCAGAPVVVAGGANSAGQAALYLASRGCQVELVVRGTDLRAAMSTYLAERVRVHPDITVRLGCEVTALAGDAALSEVEVTDTLRGTVAGQPCRGLFCFIGADPSLDWAPQLVRDRAGYVRTDSALRPQELGPVWAALERGPLPFETSIPGVFAAGDVRAGSAKRVAAAVGEGAGAVRSIHLALGASV